MIRRLWTWLRRVFGRRPKMRVYDAASVRIFLNGVELKGPFAEATPGEITNIDRDGRQTTDRVRPIPRDVFTCRYCYCKVDFTKPYHSDALGLWHWDCADSLGGSHWRDSVG